MNGQMEQKVPFETALALRDIETRIHYHVSEAGRNIVLVGKCLIEAKESGLVPHGEWEAWVERNTGLHSRTAQRLMQVAREIPADSAMAQLPLSKITTLLALPSGEQREALAERAAGEGLTLRQLQAEVDRERRRSDQLLAKYNKANAARMEEAEQRKELEHAQDALVSQRREAERALKKQIGDLERRCREMEIRCDEAKKQTGISAEAQTEIDRLENLLRRQSELRQQAQRELLEFQQQSARGDAQMAPDLTADAIRLAVNTMLSAVGYLQHSGRLLALRPDERRDVAAHIDLVAAWVDGMRGAMASDVIEIREV